MRPFEFYCSREALCTLVLLLTCTGRAQNPTPTSPRIDLQMSLKSGDYLAPEYRSIPVAVSVTNLGPDAAQDVTLDIDLPPVLSGQVQDSGYDCITSSNTIECSLGTINAGSRVSITMVLIPPPEPLGAFEVNAHTQGRGVEITPDDNQASLSTSGFGRLRLTGGGCSSVAGQDEILTTWGLPWLLCFWVRGSSCRRTALRWKRCR